MFTNPYFRPPVTARPPTSLERKEIYAMQLLDTDPDFIPPENLPKAREKYNSMLKIQEKQKKFLNSRVFLLRKMMLPVLGLGGIIALSYMQLVNRKKNLMEFEDKDAANHLTIQELEERQELAKTEREFNQLMTQVDERLKNEYRSTLSELQSYVKKAD